jgi:hypothetical protein
MLTYLDANGYSPLRPHRHKCDKCKQIFYSRRTDSSKLVHQCGIDYGRNFRCVGPCPGDEYGQLVHALGFVAKSGCKCKEIQRDMNEARPAGCIARRDEFIQRLKANYDEHYNWLDLVANVRRCDKAEAAGLVKRLGTIRPHKMIEGLFDLAVEAATLKEKNDET